MKPKFRALCKKCKTFYLPDKSKIRFFKTKYILRSIAKNKIPKDIILRKKMPLYSPSRFWLEEQRDLIINTITELGERKFFNNKSLKHVIQKQKTHRNYDLRLWSLFFLEVFLKTFFDRDPTKKPNKL